MLDETRLKANEEADRIVEKRKKYASKNERKAALTAIKNEIAKISN